jgi:glutaconate CoA-transferase subunit A
VQKEAVLAASRSLVTVERVVDELVPRPGAVVIPGWVIDAVSVAPGGAFPSYAHGVTERDNDFYKRWDVISRKREDFTAWMEEHVLRASAKAGA